MNAFHSPLDAFFPKQDKSHKTLCIPDLPYQYGYSYSGDFAVSHEREGAEMTPIVKYVDLVLNYPYSDQTHMAIMMKYVEDLFSNYPHSVQTRMAIMKKYVEDLISHYPYSDQTRIPIMKKYIDALVSNYTYSDQTRMAIMKKYVEYVENLVSNYPYSDQTQMAIISKYFEDVVSNYPYQKQTHGSDPVACTSSHDSESSSISKDILLPADR